MESAVSQRQKAIVISRVALQLIAVPDIVVRFRNGAADIERVIPLGPLPGHDGS